jgi:hypothetical protein
MKRLLICALWLAFAVTSPSVPGQTSKHPADAKSNIQARAEQKNDPASVPPVTNSPKPDADKDGAKQPASNDKPRAIRVTELPYLPLGKDWMDRVAWVAGLILVITAGIGVYLARQTLKVIQGQLGAIVNAERAWVVATPVERTPPLIYISNTGDQPPPQAKMAFAVYIKNLGKTPARISKSALVYERVGSLAQLPAEPKYKNVTVHKGWIMVPDGEPFGHLAFLTPNSILVEVEAQAVANREAFSLCLWIRGVSVCVQLQGLPPRV